MKRNPARWHSFIVLLAVMGAGTALRAQRPAPQRGVTPLEVDSPSVATPGQPGPYYALVIGINNYQYLNKLGTAVNDGAAVAKVLHDKFGFQIKLLPNATHDDIFNALDVWGQTLPDNANLVIYYAGHGQHDAHTNKAYWVPVDAQLLSKARWIMADDITSEVRAIPARHVLIVSDSCYSGTLTRDLGPASAPATDSRYLDRVLAPRSRNLMSSGGDEPVEDGGAPGHSIFSYAFLRGLNQMDDAFTGQDLFRFVQRLVAGASPQLPEYSTIRNSGDEGGDFVFFRKPDPPTAVTKPLPKDAAAGGTRGAKGLANAGQTGGGLPGSVSAQFAQLPKTSPAFKTRSGANQGSGELVVSANVDGAKILIDGLDTGEVTPHTFPGVAAGPHRITLIEAGYESTLQQFDVQPSGSTLANLTLTVPMSPLQINTVPPGADVLIDGKPVGKSPVTTMVPVGKHQWQVALGKQSKQGEIDVPLDGIASKEYDFAPQ